MKRQIRFGCLLFAIGMLIFTASNSLRFAIEPAAHGQAFSTKPLYRYQSARGQYLYTTEAKLMAGMSDGPWENEGIVFRVANGPNHTTQTAPIYQLAKTDDFGVHFFYTNKPAEADTAVGQGWTKQGIGFYLSPKMVNGTMAVYRLYKPVVPAQQNDQGLLAKISELISGPEFTEAAADVLQDAHFYTTSVKEVKTAKKSGFILEGVLGYAWEAEAASPPAALVADLVVQNTHAEDTTVTAIVRNQGTANTGAAKYEVALHVYDKQNNFLYRLNQTGPPLSPNQSGQVKFDTNGKSLMGKQYRVTVDTNSMVQESDEDNNQTAMLPGPPLKIAPATHDTGLINLAMNLKSFQEKNMGSSNFQLGIAEVSISNARDFQQDAFTPLTVLPPQQCVAGHQSNARLFARLNWGRAGKDTAAIMKGPCLPISSSQALTSMTFSIPEELGKVALIQLEIHDRLTNLKHKSQLINVGAFGVGAALDKLGCRPFLGRPDDFSCDNPTGVAACENLQKQGKPIKCRLKNSR
jgi:CARDB protein/uncharacterized protein DUF5648